MSEKDNNERKKAHHIEAPDIELSVRETFGIDIDLKFPLLVRPVNTFRQ